MESKKKKVLLLDLLLFAAFSLVLFLLAIAHIWIGSVIILSLVLVAFVTFLGIAFFNLKLTIKWNKYIKEFRDTYDELLNEPQDLWPVYSCFGYVIGGGVALLYICMTLSSDMAGGVFFTITGILYPLYLIVAISLGAINSQDSRCLSALLCTAIFTALLLPALDPIVNLYIFTTVVNILGGPFFAPTILILAAGICLKLYYDEIKPRNEKLIHSFHNVRDPALEGMMKEANDDPYLLKDQNINYFDAQNEPRVSDQDRKPQIHVPSLIFN